MKYRVETKIQVSDGSEAVLSLTIGDVTDILHHVLSMLQLDKHPRLSDEPLPADEHPRTGKITSIIITPEV